MYSQKISAAIISVCLTVAASADEDNSAMSYAFQHANIVPMTKEAILENYTVVVKEGKIADICPDAEKCIPESAKVINAVGQYILPGLADMHAHVDGMGALSNEASPEQIKSAKRIQSQQLRQYLMFGVMTIRDVAGGPLNLEARAAINANKKIGPRLYTSYVPMDGDPKLHPATTAFSSPEVAADFVRQTARDGYDMVKIYSTLSPEVFDAIMDAAKEVDIPVVGHLPMPVDFEYAHKKGMRSIEHLSGYDVACAGPDAGLQPTMADVYQGWAYCTPEKIKALAKITAKYPVWVDPTLIVVEGVQTDYDRYADIDHEARQYMSPVALAFFEYLFEIFQPRTRSGLSGTRSTRLGLVKTLSDEGVSLLIGTDTMSSGYNVHQELALFVEAGLTPYQALTAATSEVARYFETEGEFGTIVKGASADFMLLDANPLEDIANAKKINGLMFRGQWWDKTAIDQEMANIQSEYAEDRAAMKTAIAH